MKILVDSNILIDYLARREPFYQEARKLMLFGYLGEAELWVSSSQITDLFYILSDGGEMQVARDATASLEKLRQFVRISPLTGDDIDAALKLGWEDFEDACLFQIAHKEKVNFILSRDERGFARSPIAVFNANGFFEHLHDTGRLMYDEVFLQPEAISKR